MIMLTVDDELVREAQRLGHHETQEEAVAAALREYIQQQRREDLIAEFGTFDFGEEEAPTSRDPASIIALFGTIDFDPEYDYKEERRRDTEKRVPSWES